MSEQRRRKEAPVDLMEHQFKTLEEYRKTTSLQERVNGYSDFFSSLRRQAGGKIKRELEDKGYTPVYVADAIECDRGRFTKGLNGDVFSVPHDSLVKLSANYLHKSCHEIILGEPGTTKLPKSLSLLVEIMRGYGLSTRHTCLTEIIKRFERTLPQEKNCQQIIKERYIEISYDKGVYPPNIINYEKNSAALKALNNLRIRISRMLFTDVKLTLQINTLMFLAMELGTSLDYFLVQDYTRYTNVCMYHDPTDIVSDEAIVPFISYFLRLPLNLQAEMFAYVINAE